MTLILEDKFWKYFNEVEVIQVRYIPKERLLNNSGPSFY